MRNAPPIGRFKPAAILAAIAIILILVSCQNQSYGFILPPGVWNRTEATAIIAENKDIKTTDASIDFTRYPLTVVYSDGTEKEEYFDISSQISEAKEGGTAEITVMKDKISEKFTLYFYDMTLMELLSGVDGISIDPTDQTTWTAFKDFCSNKHILLEDFTHDQGLSIDKYAQEGEQYNVYIPVFENTYFRGNSGSKAQLSLSSQNVNKHLEISADGITVENVEVTITGAGDPESRVNAAGLFGDDIIIRDCILRNRIADSSSPDKENTERTGISIQKGFRFASGENPETPDNILIENTSIEGFDVSINISGYATLNNVTIDSPIVIAVDQTMLDNLNKIILTDIHSSCDETDVYLLAAAATTDERVMAFRNRLEQEGLEVVVESTEVSIGDATISPWEPGGSWDAEAT